MSAEQQSPSAVAFAVIAVFLGIFAFSVGGGWFQVLIMAAALMMAALAVSRFVIDARNSKE